MSEANLSRRLVKKLAPKLNVWHCVENSVKVGTPDVYGESMRGALWCELKQVHMYPARLATPIRFKRYTVEQANTIAEFGESGAVRSWILIQVEGDHWLFDHTKAHGLQLMQPLPWWEENAFHVWKKRLDYDQLASMI